MSETGVPYSADEHRTSREPWGGAEPDERACGNVIRGVPAGAPRVCEAARLSALDACGHRPTVFVGTGAGAVDAVLRDSPARRTGGTTAESRRGAGKVRASAVAATVYRTTRTGRCRSPKAGRRTQPAPSTQGTVAEVCEAVPTGGITEDLRALGRAGAPVESGATANSTTGRRRCAAEAPGRRAGHRGSGTGSDPASSTRPSNSADATPTTSAVTRAAVVSGTSWRSRRSRREPGAGTRAS